MNYWSKLNQKLKNLIPEVRTLLESKKLNEFDAEWIGGLPKNKQLAAANRCIRQDNNPPQMSNGYSKSIFTKRAS